MYVSRDIERMDNMQSLLSDLGAIPEDIRTARGCVVDTLGDENVQSARASMRIVGSEDFEINLSADITFLRLPKIILPHSFGLFVLLLPVL